MPGPSYSSSTSMHSSPAAPAFREAGVTNLQISPVSDDPFATVAQVKEWVS